MSVNINLVDRTDPRDLRTEKIKKIKGISFAVLVATALFALIIFALDYRFSASYVRKQQTDLLNEISSFSDKSAKIFIVNSSLTEISNILNHRKTYNDTTTKISEGLGGVEVDEYTINENGITLTAYANSLDSVDQFLNSMLGLVKDGVLTSVTLKKLAMESDRYVIELIML